MLYRFFILFLLAFSSVAGAITPDKSPTQATLVQTQQRVEKLESELNDYQHKLQIGLDASDKRITDLSVQFGAQATNQGTHATWMGNIVAITGLAISVIVAIAGWFTYFNATARAKSEAKKAAKKWFDNKADHLQKEISNLTKEVEEGRIKIANNIGKFDNETQEARDKMNALNDAMLASIPRTGDTSSAPHVENPAAVKIIQNASEELKTKPESDFSANDHYVRGLALYKNGKLESALDSFDAAIKLAINVPAAEHALYLLFKGITLGEQGKSDEEIAVYNEIDKRFGQNLTPHVRERVAGALNNKGNVLDQQNKHDEAIAVYDDINIRFGQDIAPGVRTPVAGALSNKGNTLNKQDKLDEAIAVYDEVDKRFGHDVTPNVRERVAGALSNKGIVLGKQNKLEEELATYEEIDKRFGQDIAPGVRARVVRALGNKAIALGQQYKINEELSTYDEIERRFGQDVAPGVREQVVTVLNNRGITLSQKNKLVEAISVYEDINRRFGQDLASGVQKQISDTLNGLGFAQIMLAKEGWADEQHRILLLTAASSALECALAKCREDSRAMALGNIGYALFLLGGPDAAATTRECLRLGGKNALDAQLTDAKLHRIEPQDSEYERLLKTLWAELHSDTNDTA